MDIITYEKYRIEIHSEWSVQTGYDEFEEQIDDKTIIGNGGELVDIIKKYLEDDYFLSLDVKKDKITITCFNPFNGEGSEYILKITPIPDGGEE